MGYYEFNSLVDSAYIRLSEVNIQLGNLMQPTVNDRHNVLYSLNACNRAFN